MTFQYLQSSELEDVFYILKKQIMRKIQKIMTRDLKVTLSYIPESDLVTIV